MIIKIEINGACVTASGDNLSVVITEQTTGAVPSSLRPDAFPILTLAYIFCSKQKIAVSTLSTTMFNDGKRIERLLSGLGITVQTYNDAMRWFSTNWPDGAAWPHDVPRPREFFAKREAEV